MIKIGITGGIGSGKSTLAELWESMGAYLLNADELAKQIMVEDPDVRSEIIKTFGSESYHGDGSLNRAYLAEQAFAGGRVSELNAIVHPRIPARSREVARKAEEEGYEIFLYEAALLFENLRPGFLDMIVLVLAKESVRIERVCRRDGSDPKQVRQRMERQQNFEEFTGRSDIVIRNNGSLEELRMQAKELYDRFQAISKKRD